MKLHTFATETFVTMLTNLSGLLDKGWDHAKAKGMDPEKLADARLAPDMFNLAKQVQIACLQVRMAMAVLAGQPAPPREDHDDKSFAEMRARIAATLALVKDSPDNAFDGPEDRVLVTPLFGTKVLECTAEQFLRDWTLPHFYFHVVTAYDILRHEGVVLGKPDFAAHVGPLIRDTGEAA